MSLTKHNKQYFDDLKKEHQTKFKKHSNKLKNRIAQANNKLDVTVKNYRSRIGYSLKIDESLTLESIQVLPMGKQARLPFLRSRSEWQYWYSKNQQSISFSKPNKRGQFIVYYKDKPVYLLKLKNLGFDFNKLTENEFKTLLKNL